MNALKQALFSRFGKRQLHLLKLAGSLLILIALLQIVASLALMSDSWDALKNFNNCSPEDAAVCAEVLYRTTSVSVWAGQSIADTTQTLLILIRPVVQFFWWLVVLVFGNLLYKLGVATSHPETKYKKK